MRQVRDASRYAQAVEHQDSMDRAASGETSVTLRGLGQPENFGTRAIAKFGQTGGRIFGGLARKAVALGDYGSEVLGEAPGDNAVRQSLVDLARRGELISANRVEGAPTWEETKKNPWLYPSLIAHEIPGALAYSGMMASPLGVGTIGSSFAGNIGQERALNDGRMEATAGDVFKAAPFAAGSVALERLGAKYLGFLGDELTGGVAARIGKAALGEGVTEASQSVIEGLGGSLGTERGVDGAELADQAFAGAAIGFGTGGAIRGGVETVGGLQTAVASRRRAQLSITADDEASPLNTDDIVNGRAAQMEAEANQAGETGINLPRVGGRVAVTLPGADAPIEATFTETFSDDSGAGIVLTLDNGQTVREYTDAIRDAGVKIESLEAGGTVPATNREPGAAAAQAAPTFDMQRYMQRNRAAESSGNDSARASTSSATGRYQFVEGTWLEYYKRTFGETGETREQILAKRTDGNVQDRVMERFTRDNVAAVERAGAPVTDGNVYLAHFLGASTAQKVLQAAPGTPINQVVGRDQINANKSILEGKTAAEVIAWAAQKMGSPVPQGDGLASATRPEREPFNPEGFQPRTDANIGRKIPFRAENERETAVVPATLQEVPVRYALAELDDLVPSNLSDGRINPDFPAERQPRDRTRAASQNQVRQISTRLYPRLLARDVKTSDGAPIVDASGVVDSGNGRVMALTQAYEANDGNIEAYKQMLEDEGFDATGMNKPVLVRVRDEMAPEDVAKFVRDSNARSTASMSGIETAASDAAALPASLLSLYKGGDLDTLANSDFVKGFAQAFLPASEIGAMVMKDGRPNANLLRRIDAALLVRALGPQSFIEWIVDARGGKVKSLGNALIEISGKLAQLREAAAQGIVDPSVDISDNIAEAVTVIDRARREDRDVSEFVYQTDAFSGDMNPRTVAVLRAMFKDKKQFKNQVSQEKLVATFNFYIDEAMKTAPNGGLIEASPEDVAADILELANARQTDPTAKPARKEQRDADAEQGGFSLLEPDGQDVRVPSEPSGERGGTGLQDGSREQGESEGVESPTEAAIRLGREDARRNYDGGPPTQNFTDEQAAEWQKAYDAEREAMAAEAAPGASRGTDSTANEKVTPEKSNRAPVNKVVRPENRDGLGSYTLDNTDVMLSFASDGDVLIYVTISESRYKGRAKETNEKKYTLKYNDVGRFLTPSARAEIEQFRDSDQPPAANAATPDAQTAATPSYRLKDTPSGKGLALFDATPAQLDAITMANVPRPAPRSDGALVFSKKHEAKIRAALAKAPESTTIKTAPDLRAFMQEAGERLYGNRSNADAELQNSGWMQRVAAFIEGKPLDNPPANRLQAQGWNEAGGYLADLEAGRVRGADMQYRPNQPVSTPREGTATREPRAPSEAEIVELGRKDAEAIKGGPILHPVTGQTAQEAQQEADDFLREFAPAEPGGLYGTHNIPDDYVMPDGRTRGEIRKAIRVNMLSGEVATDREAHLILGPPAAGKSMLAEPLAEARRARLVDSDIAKEQLPEFRNGVGGNAVHEESSIIATRVLEIAIDRGENLAIPVVGKTYAGVEEKVQMLRDAGYRVHLHLFEIPAREAVKRALLRYGSTGRMVPPTYVAHVGTKPIDSFNRLVEEYGDRLESYSHVSNDVPQGATPQTVRDGGNVVFRLRGSGSPSAAPGASTGQGAQGQGAQGQGARGSDRQDALPVTPEPAPSAPAAANLSQADLARDAWQGMFDAAGVRMRERLDAVNPENLRPMLEAMADRDMRMPDGDLIEMVNPHRAVELGYVELAVDERGNRNGVITEAGRAFVRGEAAAEPTPAPTPAPAPAATPSYRIEETKSGKGIDVFYGSTAQLEQVERLVPEAKAAQKSNGAYTYSKKHRAAIENVLGAMGGATETVTPEVDDRPAGPRVLVNELNMADEIVRQANEIDLPKIEGATYRIVKGREAYDLERDGSQILRMAPADSSAEVVQKAVKSALATARSDAKAKAATGTNMLAGRGAKTTAGKGVIGQNSRGQDVFEDERGVRSYVESGIRITESVGIVPGGGFSIDLARRWDEFKTVSELGQERAQKEQRIGEEYDALENDMRRAQAELDAFGAEQGAQYKSPGIKGRARVVEKAVNEDGYNSARDIKDLARSAFIVDSMAQADALAQAIAARFTVVQDKGWKTLDSGYADHKIIVESNGIKAEIQIVPAPMWAAKKEGGANKLYKEQRAPGISEERFAELQQQQVEIYSAALVGTDFESLSNSSKSAAGNSRSASSRESDTPSLVANPGASAQTESSRQTSARGGDTENTAASRNSTSLNVGDTSTSTSDVGANPQESNNPSGNRLVSDERAAELRKRLREKLNPNRLNAGIDPEVLAIGAELAVYHIESGARKFIAMSKRIASDLGMTPAQLRQYLRGWYNGARDMMEDAGQSIEGMDSSDSVRALLGSVEEWGATIPEDPATQRQENNDADVQDGLSDSDGGASPADVQAPAQDRGARGARRQEGGGGQEALFDFDGRSGADGQRGDRRPAGAQDGNRAGVRDANRVSERDGADGSRSAGDVKGRNWLIEPGSLAEDRGPAQKARDNIAAIETVKRVKAEGRLATRDEQALIARYVGWGGLKNAFPDAQGNYGKGFEQIGPRLRELLTDSEYDTARRSIQYAHYTAEPVVRKMWQIAWRLGFKGGTVFEPGMGTGNFLGMMPKNVAGRTQYSGLEFDGLTADIAKLLYPESGVRHADYTETPRMMNAVDLAIGNPPFSETVVSGDKDYGHLKFVLHDFFFAKTLDAVKPGGVLMFVTSAGTMNKKGDKARKWLAERADLVGAIRLPGNAFKQNAGTEVTTDIVILRKRAEGEPAGDASWTETVPVAMKDRDGNTVEGNVNRYFVENPKMVLGEQGMFDKLVSGPRYAVRAPANFDLVEALGQAVDALPRDIMKPASRDEGHRESDIDLAATERKDGSFYVGPDNRLMVYRNGVGVPVEAPGKGVKGGISKDNQERIRKLIPVRDALRAVYAADLNEDSAAADKARAELNKTYDAFIAKFGPINKQEVTYRPPSRVQVESARAKAREEARLAGNEWDDGSFDPRPLEDRNATLAEIAREREAARDAAVKAGRTWNEGSFDPADVPETAIAKHPNLDAFLASDEEGYRLAAIESYNPETGQAKKGLVFERSVVRLDKKPEITSTQDALFYSLNQRGRPDIALISELTGKGADAVLDDLKDRVFAVPDRAGDYESAEVYLSGDVRAKLAVAQEAAKQDSTYQRNVAALEQALPRPLTQSEIAANLGMPWLPPKVVEQFATEHMGLKTATVKYVGALSQWTAAGDSYSAAARAVWGAGGRNALDLLEAALNRRRVRVLKKMSDGSTILDVTATQAATAKIAEMKEAFSQWVYSDPARTTELVDLYNRDFNSLVAPKFNGDYLTTPGLNAAWKWRPHQSAVIARIIQSGNTYMAHEVGSGKTSASIGAAMEMKRLGMVNKPMFVVPNHMLGQFSKEFLEQYPLAKIRVADETRFHTSRRKEFIAQVAAEDLDAIIITHSSFKMIPLSNEFVEGMILEEISELERTLNEIDKSERVTRRNIEQQKESLEQRLKGLTRGRKDQVFTFEEMGVDYLFVDEAHEFRKLDFATKMGDVKGIDPQGSAASYDLFAKVRYLESKRPGRSVTLMSGTPITNTMAELYSVSRYLQMPELEKRGLAKFDAWAGAYGDTVTALEQDPAGGYKSQTRFAKFVNVPELSVMVRQVMDVVSAADLRKYVTLPELKGGERQMVIAEQTAAQSDYQDQLKRRMEAIEKRSGPPKKGDDILLSVIGDGRKNAIDARLVDPSAPKDPNSKLELMIENVARIYKETKRVPLHKPQQGGYSEKPVDYGPATQMIFSDFGINGDFPVHKYIKNQLVQRGIPAKHIALMSDFNKHVAKQRLFNDMNEGKVRILIGSVAKMGTGVNAQQRLIASHNVDPQWYPANDTQRNGRIIRQGNMNPEVEIFDYSTEGTYDSQMWALMAKKARFIEGFMRGDPDMREMEDLGEASQYEQAQALTTSDPRVMQLVELKQERDKLHLRKLATERREIEAQQTLKTARNRVVEADQEIAAIEQDIAKAQIPTEFTGTVGGKTFTERAEFGAALLEAVGELDDKLGNERSVRERVGEYAGFTIDAELRISFNEPVRNFYVNRSGGRENRVEVSTSTLGQATRIENVIKGFESEKAGAEAYRKRYQDDIEQYENLTFEAFSDQPRITTLDNEIAALEKVLEAENKAKEGSPTAEDFEDAAEIVIDGRAIDNQGNARPLDSRPDGPDLFDAPQQPERTMTQAQRAELEARQKQQMARRGGQQGLGDQEGGLFSSERDQGSLFLRTADGEPITETQAQDLEADLRARLDALGLQRVQLRVTTRQQMEPTSTNPPDGRYYPSMKLIEVASNAVNGSTFTLDHEAIHALRDLGAFNKTDWALLKKAAWDSNPERRASIKRRYPDLHEEAQIEEAVADDFADYQQFGATGFTGSVFRIIRNTLKLFEGIRNALRGKGFVTDRRPFDVLDDIRTGRTAQDIGRFETGNAVNKRPRNPATPTGGPDQFAESLPLFEDALDRLYPNKPVLRIETPLGNSEVMADSVPAARRIILARASSLDEYNEVYDNVMAWRGGPASFGSIKVRRGLPEDLGGFTALDSRPATTLADLGGTDPTWKGKTAKAFETFRTAMQDRYLPLLSVQRRIETMTGQRLPNSMNPYLGEELMAGRIGSRLDALHTDTIGPLFDDMARSKITTDELESYLYARHAPERNARMQSINPELGMGEGSGMTDIEAAAIMNRIRDEGKMADMERLAAQVDKMRDDALDYRVQTGLMSQKQADEWRATYDYYVPLRGFAEVEGEMSEETADRINRSGGGINVRGPESKRAFGRRSKAESPLAYLILQAEEAIVRGETNRVAQKFVQLARANPDDDFWKVNKVTMARRMNEESGQVEEYVHYNLAAADKDWTVVAKENGKEVRVTMNRANPAARRLADSMRNLTQHQLDWVTRYLGTVNRYLSTVNTTLLPEFVVTNAFRDMQTAAINLQGVDVPGITRATAKYYFGAVAAATKGSWGKGSGEWENWYQQFIKAGGRVYFNQVEDIGLIRKRIDSAFELAAARAGDKVGARVHVKRGLLAVRDAIENTNLGVENAVRLAAFRAAREAGVDQDKAASIAKNLTVNFNRRGTFGPAMNAAYLFYNASMQGSVRILAAAKHPKVQKVLAGIVVAGAMNEMLNMMVSGDDDDGESYYDKIPAWEKSRNMIFFYGTGPSDYFKVPLPYGYNVFWETGRTTAEITRRGGDRWKDSAGNLLLTIVDSFNPVGGSQSLMNFFAPTILDPVVDLERNADFTGRPIMPKDNPFDVDEPDAQRYFGSVGTHWRTVTDFLTEATGGSKVEPGAIDVSPETLEYMVGVIFGGAGAFVDRTVGLPKKMMTGEVETNDIPFARKVIGSDPSWLDTSNYYDRVAEVERTYEYTKRYIEGEQLDEARAYAERNEKVLTLVPAMREAQKLMREVRKEKREIAFEYEMGRLTDEERRTRYDRAKEVEDRIVTAFNTRWNQTLYGD